MCLNCRKQIVEIVNLENMDREALPVQLCVLQDCVMEFSPGQSTPPSAGAGDVHVRVRVWFPPPHVTEHAA